MCDYLAVMLSSVSSEHAFLQGGITISKCRNQFMGDIVEALQCIKSGIQHDLLFREPAPSSRLESEELDEELEGVSGEDSGKPELSIEEPSWDNILIDENDKDTIYWSE